MKVYQGDKEKYLLVINRGEKLVEAITRFAKENKLKGGLISGIGALMNAELGFYHLDTKTYQRTLFDKGDFELISLHGNITKNNGEYFTHVHCSLGKEDYSVIGGHLFEAEVAVVAEVYITPLGVLPERDEDKSIGLNLICGIAD